MHFFGYERKEEKKKRSPIKNHPSHTAPRENRHSGASNNMVKRHDKPSGSVIHAVQITWTPPTH